MSNMINNSASHDATTSTCSNIVGDASMIIYLYVKTHNKTGKKYLGQTTSEDPHAYPGSGLIWESHLKKHGRDYSTEILLATQDQAELKKMGQYYSALWNVVDSDEWANLQPEEGQGFASGDHHHSKKPGYINPMTQEKNRRAHQKRMLDLGNNHWAKTDEFKLNMCGDKNPAHHSNSKDRMANNNPRNLPHNVERFKKMFAENNPMSNSETVAKMSGTNHYLHDPTIRRWVNRVTGQKNTMTRMELVKAYGLSTGDVGRVIRGERPHTKGWALDE